MARWMQDGSVQPEILVPGNWGPETDAGREESVRKGFWQTLKKAARRFSFAEDLVAAYYCALDPATPARVRATLFAALAYFVLPVDAIADVAPVIGFTDDAAVLMAAIGMVKTHILLKHRLSARDALFERR